MAAKLYNKGVSVKLDEEFVDFISVITSPPRELFDLNIPTFEVELTLSSGEVIYDDGRRVEVIMHRDELA